MSKVLTPQKTPTPSRACNSAASKNLCDSLASSATTSARTTSEKSSVGVSDFDDITSNSSILEFLSKEQECLTDADPESIFQEVSRLADNTDLRTVDELLLEAERLIQQQVRLGGGGDVAVNGTGDNNCVDLARAVHQFAQHKMHSPNRAIKQTLQQQQQQHRHQQPPLSHSNNIKMNTRYTRRIENCNPQTMHYGPRSSMADTISMAHLSNTEEKKKVRRQHIDSLQTPQTPTMDNVGNLSFHVFVENLPSDSVISEESTPRDLQNYTANERSADATTTQLHDNTDDDEDTLEEITEGLEMLELPQFEVNTATTISTKIKKATTPLTTTTTTKTTATPTTMVTEAALRINDSHAKVATMYSDNSSTTTASTASSTTMAMTTTTTPPTPLMSGGVARVGTKCDYNLTFVQHASNDNTKQSQTQQHASAITTTTTAVPTATQLLSPFSENFGTSLTIREDSVNLRRNSTSTNNAANSSGLNSNNNNNNNSSSNIELNARRGSMTTSDSNKGMVSVSDVGSLGGSLAYSQTLPRTFSSYKQKQPQQQQKQHHHHHHHQQQQQQQRQQQFEKQMAGAEMTTTAMKSNALMNATEPIKPMAMFSDKSVGSSPKHLVSTLSSPIEQVAIAESITRQHALKQEIEVLQEKLKDTEERLESVRIQHETMSQMQRALRETNSRLQEESEILKLDVQHLNECANVLRTELQAARHDRNDALELQRALRAELDESQQDRKRAHEQKDKDAKVIQDLQRQCREMERILVRKHPDSVSALIVASNSPGMSSLNDQENVSSRKLLEQRIAQLESDAKEQDRKAQQILANVQARFNTVQAKYETHIADLETQVLSLQEINTKLNAQIESQVRTLDHMMQKRSERYYNNCTQTDNITPNTNTTGTQTSNIGLVGDNDDDVNVIIMAKSTGSISSGKRTPAMRDHSTNTIGCTSASVCQQQQQHPHHHHHHQSTASSSTSSTANSTPNNSRPNSKQSGMRRLAGGCAVGTATGNFSVLHVSKLPVSQSESTLSLIAAQSGTSTLAKEDSQLLASVRNMRVDLAIKNKAMQRLTRELDDCKKTIRKLQRERDANVYIKSEQKAHSTNSGSPNTNNSTIAGSNSLRRHDVGGSGGIGVIGNSSYNNHSQYHYPDHVPASTENQVLREAQNKCRLLEADYKTLHEKRLQDLKTLQSAHERELASCNDTVRVLQQRLNERGDDTQKRRKMPVDYYALKAKVSLLERRHSEREERLHMLVEALSKGRLNGALEDLIQENNNK